MFSLNDVLLFTIQFNEYHCNAMPCGACFTCTIMIIIIKPLMNLSFERKKRVTYLRYNLLALHGKETFMAKNKQIHKSTMLNTKFPWNVLSKSKTPTLLPVSVNVFAATLKMSESGWMIFPQQVWQKMYEISFCYLLQLGIERKYYIQLERTKEEEK